MDRYLSLDARAREAALREDPRTVRGGGGGPNVQAPPPLFDFFVPLTGQDFPLLPVDAIGALLLAGGGGGGSRHASWLPHAPRCGAQNLVSWNPKKLSYPCVDLSEPERPIDAAARKSLHATEPRAPWPV